eukprot:TRINITY_DN5216_c0_g2_i1.p1 TRINITY_DN5216_c0_g2~~TRINITY_DN5216_c0_g2_i1.p1  ORF type:complete len:392 (-),score=33.55 TRINITY_DN5216_c0_g2_i1:184-1359(-)
MVQRAFLVGCNYPGSDCPLRGCVNDVNNMKSLLLNDFGFTDQNITIMIDTDDSALQPTGANIKNQLQQLVEQSQEGDVLFFHFSGHGTQVPGDPDQDEKDAKDEAIVPTDMNLILDDDFRVIFKNMHPDVKFTMIADCCHSGGMLDHASVEISGSKDPNSSQISSLVNPDLLSQLFGVKELPEILTPGGENEGVKNRSLPVDSLLGMLSSKTGTQVDLKSLRSSLVGLFGESSSRSIQKYVGLAQQLLQQVGGASVVQQASGGILQKLFGTCCGGTTSQEEPQFAAPLPHAGQKPPPSDQLHKDVGSLITGCQSFETSADACPGGDPSRAYGALSNAIQQVVKARKEQGQLQSLTYRQIVVDVRELLLQAGFKQNPCLECSSKNADSLFIL